MNKYNKIKSRFRSLGSSRANSIIDKWIDKQVSMGRPESDDAADNDNCIFHGDTHYCDYADLDYYLCNDCCYSALFPTTDKSILNILNTRI
jgi:hypothetical protein